MRVRRAIVLGTAALAIGTAGALLLSDADKDAGEEGVVRIVSAPSEEALSVPAEPAATPTPPAPVDTGDRPGRRDDPPAPHEPGSPNYAEIGVLPAI
ncbi:hypothetical protein LZK98_15710 [Sphingomonas cannabina]|uniref:hypothetical protein n=1 Tax=Sphingomonas cannabina TaxID=2899123 RepID=UPI001F3E9A11|nr:hypothetical protein [Sphingomonas cannabina]UIJ44496.1 hypothetical protein LZK98_15710 [Sphingomonas cannabina]